MRSEQIDPRLLPLTEYEKLYAEALRMELDNISNYVGFVREYLQGKKQTPVDASLKSFWQKLGQATKKRFDHKLTDEELENFTRYLLYQSSIYFPEMDVLLVLPLQRRMIGTVGTNFLRLKGQSNEIFDPQFLFIIRTGLGH